MSLFVNEAQFSSSDDFARYPRDEQHDLDVAAGAGVDVVFAPTARELYPFGFPHLGPHAGHFWNGAVSNPQ